MALKIAGNLFTGPVAVEKCVVRENQIAAVYAIVAKEDPPWNPQFRLVAVGETGTNGMVFADHPDRAQWAGQSDGRAVVYLCPVGEKHGGASRRRDIVRNILDQYAPPDAIIVG